MLWQRRYGIASIAIMSDAHRCVHAILADESVIDSLLRSTEVHLLVLEGIKREVWIILSHLAGSYATRASRELRWQ